MRAGRLMRPHRYVDDDPAAFRQAFAIEIAETLRRTPRQIPSKYLYDELGSALFEAICRLPWYRITRAESAMLVRHARDIVRPMQRPVTLAELGCGSGDKIALLVGAAGEQFPAVHLIDISEAALDMARYRLQAIGMRAVITHHLPYEQGLLRAVQQRPRDGALLVLFLGSNIGNFAPAVARDFLVRIRRSLRAGDELLLGTDLVKSEQELMLAYDDPLHVTAAFNRNLLRRINDELGGNFDLESFAHRVAWNAAEQRVEAYLVSSRRQHVVIPAAQVEFELADGESIWTESSHKYQREQVVAEGLAAGFSGGEQWIDEDAKFALTRFGVS
jgi:dimethylhistidine N-methyltransferase